MARWLDRFLPPPPTRKRPSLPSLDIRGALPSVFLPPKGQSKLPNASLIYGVAAAALLAIGLYFLFTGEWFTGVLLLLPAGCLFGFALHFIRYSG